MRRTLNVSLLFLTILALSVGSSVKAATTSTSTRPTYVPYEGEFVSAIVMVPKKHTILYAYQPDRVHPAASLTKLANAMAFLKRNLSWDKRVILRKQDEVGGGRLRVSTGTGLTVRDLFYASITASANNAAMALARVSGLTYKGFILQMNKEAKAVGLTHTIFVDASGMNPKNLTTARDMALLGEAAFSRSVLRRAAGSPSYRMSVGTPRVEKVIKNTNTLLTQDPDIWVVGGKTGYLEESMHNLVTWVRPMDQDGNPIGGHDLVIVVLGSQTTQEMFRSTKKLAQWAWQEY